MENTEKFVVVAYGKHTSDGKEYVWRLSARAIKEKLDAGDTAIAETATGYRHIHITRIDQLPADQAGELKEIRCRHKPLPLLTSTQAMGVRRRFAKAGREKKAQQQTPKPENPAQ